MAQRVTTGAGLIDRTLIAYARGPEHPSKIRTIRWLIRRLAAGRVRIHYASGTTITIDPADYIGWAILRTGYYEPASLGLALRIVAATPGLFVDVGANFGWYSCAVAAIARARVIAIEPDCANCAALRANLAANGFRNAVIVNVAAGAYFEAARMIRRAHGNSGTVMIDPGGATGAFEGDWVATAPLDILLGRIVIPPVRPILIKIDVEGFEPQVLAGLDFTGPFRPRNIIMEYEPALSEAVWGGFAGVQAFFADRGYEVLNVDGGPVIPGHALTESNIWARER